MPSLLFIEPTDAVADALPWEVVAILFVGAFLAIHLATSRK